MLPGSKGITGYVSEGEAKITSESEFDELHNGKACTSTLGTPLNIIQFQQHLLGDIIKSSVLVVCQLTI
jgi:hypothetical protein